MISPYALDFSLMLLGAKKKKQKLMVKFIFQMVQNEGKITLWQRRGERFSRGIFYFFLFSLYLKE
jgi:hypothetical protein